MRVRCFSVPAPHCTYIRVSWTITSELWQKARSFFYRLGPRVETILSFCPTEHEFNVCYFDRGDSYFCWCWMKSQEDLGRVRYSPWPGISRAGFVIVSHYHYSSELIETNLWIRLKPYTHHTSSSSCSRGTVTTPCQ